MVGDLSNLEYQNKFETKDRVSIKEMKVFLDILKNESKTCNSINGWSRHNVSKTRNVSNYSTTVLTLLLVAISSSFVVSYTVINLYIDNLNYKIQTPLKTEYLVQNLSGDTVNTWRSWHLGDNQALTVNIVDAGDYPQDKVNAVKDAILDEQSIKIDNSLLGKGITGTSSYYLGWEGALKQASHAHTQFHIPIKFNVIESPNGEGDVIINLSNLENEDGYTGYTKSDTDGNQILKSTITIYNVDSLSSQQLSAITRHEFGHAMGLGHSTDPQDLMHATIQTNYPFISECDISAISSLYDGHEANKVMCDR